MPMKDAAIVASRALALLFTIWGLSEAATLPAEVHAFLRYSPQSAVTFGADGYWYHHYLIALGFLIVRIVGFWLLAWWLYKGGPEVEELLFPESRAAAVESIERTP
jgi:hypothetical protein